MHETVVELFAVLLAGFYCVVFHSFRTADDDRRYVRPGLVLGALGVGLAAGKASGAMGFDEIRLGAMAGSVVVVGTVGVLQGWVIRAAGAVTVQKELAAGVIELKRWTAAVGALCCVPAVLVFTGDTPVRDEVAIYLAVGEVVALAVVFLVRTLRLFVRQKVSILVWFLYLCGVEVVPVCAVAALVVRFV